MMEGMLVRALRDFNSCVEGELSLLVGSIVQIHRKVDRYWLYGCIGYERRGTFPASHVVEVQLPLFHDDGHEQIYVSKADFKGQVVGDLPFRKGDLIVGEAAVDVNWHRGRCNGQSGIFPLNLVWPANMELILKALQEFQTYCTTCSEVALISSLPYWPRMFNRLSWDYDRRVREASHKAHFQLVSRAGRNLAPHLKALMGPWLMGRCDPHGPAASVANAAFSEAFKGPAKQIDAIVFCKDDIINFLSDVVYNLSVQSLCDSEVCPLEDSESTHSRLVSVALLALTLYLNAVPKAKHDKSVDTYASFLSDPKFWKFSKSKEPSIRAAWFDLMSAFYRIQPSVLEPHLARCSPLLLGALDEEDPVVCPLVWDAVLHLIVVHKAAWNHVNVQKAVVPKLWSISKKGFEGNAVVVCPNLLPFLSNFPDAVFKDKRHFYNVLFTNMIQALDLPKIQASHSDCSAIVSALIECIRYVATTSRDFEEELVLNHVLPIVESSLMKKNSALSVTPLYALVGDYLTSKRGQHLEATFWQKVGPSCLSAVDQLGDEESSSILERLIYMFSCFAGLSLHEGPAPTNKSARRKVMFASVDNKDVNSNQKKKYIVANKKATWTQLPEGPFLELASKLCVAVQDRYALKNAPDHLEFLAKMVPDFATPMLFRRLLALTDDLKVDQSTKSANHLSKLAMKYFEGPLKRWLHETQSTSPDEKNDRIAAALVRLILRAVLPFIGPQDKASVLDQVCRVRDTAILENLLRTIMKTNDNVNWLQDPVVRTWFRGSTLKTAILAFTEASINNTLTSGTTCKEDQAAWRLLSLCFESFVDLEPILPMDVLNVILESLRTVIQVLAGTDGSATGGIVVDGVLTLVAKFAKGLFSGMPNCWKIAACEDILLAFFVLLCRPLVMKPDTAKVLEDVLIDGAQLLVSNKGGGQLEAAGFLYKVSVHIHDIQIKGVTNHLETVAKLFVALLLAVKQASLPPTSSDDVSLTMDMLDLALLTVDEDKPLESEAVEQNLLVMQGELCILSPPPRNSESDGNQSRRNGNHATSVLLASAYLASEGILAFLNDISWEEYISWHRLIPHVIKILFASTYSKVSLRPGNKLVGSAEAAELRKWSPIVDSNLRTLLCRLSLTSARKMVSECSRLSQDRGFLWSYAFVELINEMDCASELDLKKMLASDQNVLSVETSQGALHNVQLHLKDNKVDVAFGDSIVRSILDDPDVGNVRCLAVLASAVHLLRRDDVHSVMDIMVSSKCDAVFSVPMEWDQVCLSAQVCRLLAGVVAEHAELLTRDHWDHVLLYLGTWLEKVDVKEQMADRLGTPLLATSIFRLSASVSSAMSRLKSADELDEDLRTEWDEFFVERIYGRTLFLFVVLAEELTSSLPCAEEYVLESLTKSLIGIPASVYGLGEASTARKMNSASGNQLPTLLIPDWDDDDDHHQSTPIRVKTALNHLCPLLGRRFRAVQYGAYHALKELAHSLPKQCDAATAIKEDVVVVKEDSKDAAIPGALLATLTHSRYLLEQGPLAERKPGNDDGVFEEHDWPDIIGFLLVWELVLRMFSQSSSEVRSRNASYFKESGFVQHLLNCLFCLMPNNVALLDVSRADATTPGKNLASKRSMFAEEPLLDPQAPFSVCDVQHLACSVYLAAVQHIPALVRDWFNGLDRRTSSLVERFTVTNVSPLLCSKDLAAVRLADGAHLLRGLKVRVRPGAREVLATCTVEEISFEIVVRLADNHPLGPITIEAGRPIGVSNSQWSYWTLQLTTFLMHQNGSILDGLLLWKRNIDKKFEGVQECYVCFYVLHGTSYQLPKHLCRTCKKKFHSSCLYKWFSTSGHSTCPLCRSIF